MKAMYRDTFLCNQLSCKIQIKRENPVQFIMRVLNVNLCWCPAGSPPQFLQFSGDQKIRAGEKVELLGNFGGSAPITCTWLKFKKPVGRVGGGQRVCKMTDQWFPNILKQSHHFRVIFFYGIPNPKKQNKYISHMSISLS